MDREEADGADGVEAVCEWLATEAGLCEEEMHEARPLLLRERVYTVHRLELLRQEKRLSGEGWDWLASRQDIG